MKYKDKEPNMKKKKTLSEVKDLVSILLLGVMSPELPKYDNWQPALIKIIKDISKKVNELEEKHP